MNYCHSLAVIGNFDKSQQYWEEAKILAKSHGPSIHLALSYLVTIKHLR